jgi:hypothetical protein
MSVGYNQPTAQYEAQPTNPERQCLEVNAPTGRFWRSGLHIKMHRENGAECSAEQQHHEKHKA